MPGVRVAREDRITLTIVRLTDGIVLLLLLLERGDITATVRCADTKRILAVRKTDATIPDETIQGVAVEFIERFGGIFHVLELYNTFNIATSHTTEEITYLDEAHGPVTLLAEAQLAIPELPREELPQAVLQIAEGVATRRCGSREVANVQGVDRRVVVTSSASAPRTCARSRRRQLRRRRSRFCRKCQRSDRTDQLIFVSALRATNTRRIRVWKGRRNLSRLAKMRRRLAAWRLRTRTGWEGGMTRERRGHGIGGELRASTTRRRMSILRSRHGTG